VTRRSLAASPWIAACAGLLVLGCQDLRDFERTWRGGLVGDPALAQGFGGGGSATLSIRAADHLALHGTRTLPPLYADTPIDSIARASGDALGGISVGEGSLRTYLAFAAPSTGMPALLLVSLFPDDRVELRVVRGTDDLYGVFALKPAAASR
jgi:hypothetical protein